MIVETKIKSRVVIHLDIVYRKVPAKKVGAALFSCWL